MASPKTFPELVQRELEEGLRKLTDRAAQEAMAPPKPSRISLERMSMDRDVLRPSGLTVGAWAGKICLDAQETEEPCRLLPEMFPEYFGADVGSWP